MMDIEDTPSARSEHLCQATIACDELGLNNWQLAMQVFALWAISPLLELQLKPLHRPYAIRQRWRHLIGQYSHASANRQQRDELQLSFQRNIFYAQHLEEKIKFVFHHHFQKILNILILFFGYNAEIRKFWNCSMRKLAIIFWPDVIRARWPTILCWVGYKRDWNSARTIPRYIQRIIFARNRRNSCRFTCGRVQRGRGCRSVQKHQPKCDYSINSNGSRIRRLIVN